MDKKILYTTSSEDIINSIANICGCSVENINSYLSESKSFHNKNIEEINIEDFFKKIGINFISKKELFEIIKFDSIIISHLTTRIGEMKDIELGYLNDALVTDNELSRFLKENGLKFRTSKKRIIGYYNNEEINWDNCINDERVPRIKNRFNIDGDTYSDNCVNGFLFNDSFWEDGAVDSIKACPEIIIDICESLDRQDIISKWENTTKAYGVLFIADIQDMIFDIHTRTSTYKSKIYLIYKYVILYLVNKHHKIWSCRCDNTVLRLKDNLSVDKENIIGFYEIID